MEVKHTNKSYLAVVLLATVLTVSLVFGLTLVTSNHLSGTSLPQPLIILTGNTTGTTYVGDTFILVANLTNWPLNGGNGIAVSFYNGAVPIGTVTSGNGGLASITWMVNGLSWDLYATAQYS
jgi:hypothetical protein